MTARHVFKLRFPAKHISRWADKYSYTANDTVLRQEIGPAAMKRGWLNRSEFLEICKWKTQRTKSRCAQNDEFTIRVVSRAALATDDESIKIDLLRTLAGVEWPTASTLLHFCDKRPYPILDYRALWSLGHPRPPVYTMDFWLAYLAYTRGLAKRMKQDIRTIDRALWQYSKTRQRSKS